MFSLRLQLSAAPQGEKSQGINQVLLKEEPFSTEEINLISQLFEVKVKSFTDMETLEKVTRGKKKKKKKSPDLVEKVHLPYFFYFINVANKWFINYFCLNGKK